MAKIILIEDNDSIREAAASYLRLEDHDISEFARLSGVLEAIELKPPDMIILDVMLPDGDGFLFAKKLRKKYSFPILFLTARSSESDRITGFDVGADDYIVKPFSPRELVLRVAAVLRRSGLSESGKNHTQNYLLNGHILTIDPVSICVLLDEKEVSLTPAEWKILKALAEKEKTLVSRSSLLGELDYLAEGSERTIDTHIKNIRIKLGNPLWIETIRGFGYKFIGVRQ